MKIGLDNKNDKVIEGIRKENDIMHASLDDLNNQVSSLDIFSSKKQESGMKIVDLLQQRKLEKERALGDYSERVKECPDETGEGEPGESKNKKKQKRKNKKKKKDK